MLKLIGASFVALALAASAPAFAQDIQEAQVGIDGGGDIFLYGALVRPTTDAPAPFVLIVPSATADLNGNSGGTNPNTYKLLAQALAAKGVGSLRYDRRGVGASKAALGPEEDVVLDTYVNDVVTWAKFLALQPKVKCVALLGHAEGALIAALAAKKTPMCGIIEVGGAGRPAWELFALQLKAASDAGKLPRDSYIQASHILDELRAGRRTADVPLSLASLLRPSLQPYLISWLTRDPIEALRGLYPILIIQGDKDNQAGSDDARRLANVSRRSKLVTLAGADHALKLAPANPDEIAADAPIAPQAPAAIAEFVLAAH